MSKAGRRTLYSHRLLNEIEEWICEHGLMYYGGAMLKDMLAYFHYDNKTHRNWLKRYPEYAQVIENGRETFKQRLTRDISTTLAEAAKGYEREETETEYRPNPQNPNQPTITKMKRKKVYFQPNVGAAIFLLTNLDPEHYQNRQRTDIALRRGDDKEMTIDEINKEIERLDKLDRQQQEE